MNGEPVGEKVPDNGLAVFEVPLADGANEIEAIGTSDGGATRTDAVDAPLRRPEGLHGGLRLVRRSPSTRRDVQRDRSDGLVYEADPSRTRRRSVGATVRTTGSMAPTSTPLSGVPRDRSSDLRSSKPLTAGVYDLTFGFMEPEFDVPGRRVFSVLVDGEARDRRPRPRRRSRTLDRRRADRPPPRRRAALRRHRVRPDGGVPCAEFRSSSAAINSSCPATPCDRLPLLPS